MDYSYLTNVQSWPFIDLPPTPSHSSAPSVGEYGSSLSLDHFEEAFIAYQQIEHYVDTDAQGCNIPHTLETLPRRSARRSAHMLKGRQENVGREATEVSTEAEKEILTRSQSRRKAQNRAAQRAFRQRRDRHVKELEARVTSLEQSSVAMTEENGHLKQENLKLAIENRVLRATAVANSSSSSTFRDEPAGGRLHRSLQYSRRSSRASSDTSGGETRPRYVPGGKTMSTRSPRNRPEVRVGSLLAAGEIWDYMQRQTSVQMGLVSIPEVCKRLKRFARCGKEGVVFEECDVKIAIDESIRIADRDELI